ncbi:hypothetical protein PAXRUDRAFT_834924 [Paxillus rubicundulus Ve08.2h10]|uniref:Uncharacterized protein n=1 Tax=Paxillus rubicundulus Ve08.2h10 TaxID=930991 RepID=A0A0D0D2A3_9AGAM|nr:hypothetical protein PAXRUDRAFT_834924 [Paxillus rubicundulus Ve08.2h10]
MTWAMRRKNRMFRVSARRSAYTRRRPRYEKYIHRNLCPPNIATVYQGWFLH